jgi:predicted transcriptional regulator of viral defense system
MGTLDSKIANLFTSEPLRRSKDFTAAGIPRVSLSRALGAGQVKRLARGIYCLADYQPNEGGDLALVARKVPEAIVCLLSALSYHEITTQLPSEIWIAIPHKAWTPRLEYPSLRIVRYSNDIVFQKTMEIIIEGVPVKMTTVEKTIADCFKFRSKIGLDVALEALRMAKEKGKLDRDELWTCAKLDRVNNVMLPYLEAIS